MITVPLSLSPLYQTFHNLLPNLPRKVSSQFPQWPWSQFEHAGWSFTILFLVLEYTYVMHPSTGYRGRGLFLCINMLCPLSIASTRLWSHRHSPIGDFQRAGGEQSSEAMAQLGQTVLLIASAFLVLQLTELVAATTGKASFYTAPFCPSACFGCDPNQIPPDNIFAAGGDSSSANIWNNGANCGKRFRVQCQGNGCNGHGPISVKIIDRCPNGCAGGRAFDLSDTAFSTIANLDVGVITVEYSGPTSSLDDEDAETFIAEVGRIGQ